MSDIAKNILKFSDRVNFLTNDRNLTNVTEKFTNDNNSEEEKMKVNCYMRMAFRGVYSLVILGLLMVAFGYNKSKSNKNSLTMWVLAFLSLVAPDIVLIITGLALITGMPGIPDTKQLSGSFSATSSDGDASNKLLLSATPDIFN